MLGILNLKGLTKLLLLILGLLFVSCATEKQTALVSDPDDRADTLMPWNKQEKWEQQGQGNLANMMEGRR